MISLLNILFWLFFLLFFIAIFLAFFIPGDLTLRKINLSIFQRLVLGTVIGMILWGWQGFIFGYLGIRWLSYLYLLIVFILWIKFHLGSNFFNLSKVRFSKGSLLLISIIAIGTLSQLSTIWFTGIFYSNGLYFCCGNTSDSLYHIALTNQLIKHFPPYEPGIFGVLVQNYHYWGNLVIGELIRVFKLPLIQTQYQYSTLLISLFLGLSAVAFGQIVKLGRNFILWLVFFLYFGGDLIFLLLFALGKGFSFNMSSLEDGARFLVNPPRAFSIIVFFVGISLLILWLRKKDWYTGLLMALVLGSLIGFKVYTGIFALSGLALLGGYFLISRNFRMIPPLIITLILSLVIYLPVNNNAGGLYFTGLWLFENFIVQPVLGLERLELARVIYVQHHSWLRVLQYELIFFSLFVVSIFGSKLIGIFQTKKSLSLLPSGLNIFMAGGFIVSAIAGFFFQQSSGGANTFNFLVSIFIIGSIYTSLACFYWIGKVSSKFKIVIVILVLLLTLPRVAHEVSNNIMYLVKKEGFLIENSELQGLNYIKEKTAKSSLVLVDNRGFEMDKDSPYISFMADRPMFLSGKGILESHGIDTSEKLLLANTIFMSSNVTEVCTILFKNRISYIYLSTHDNLPIEKSASCLKNVFQNKKVKILRVLPETLF
ncbi:MAG: hypothetical protein AAB521_02265 [Patescibacteria group bacterium]